MCQILSKPLALFDPEVVEPAWLLGPMMSLRNLEPLSLFFRDRFSKSAMGKERDALVDESGPRDADRQVWEWGGGTKTNMNPVKR